MRRDWNIDKCDCDGASYATKWTPNQGFDWLIRV